MLVRLLPTLRAISKREAGPFSHRLIRETEWRFDKPSSPLLLEHLLGEAYEAPLLFKQAAILSASHICARENAMVVG